MKREQFKKSEDFIDWLKSIGCIFYFDSADGDSKDKINNVPLVLSGNGSFVYDSSKKAFLGNTPSSSYKYIGIWNNGVSKTSFLNQSWSFINIVERKTTTNGKYLQTLGSNNTSDRNYLGQFSAFYNNTHNIGVFLDGIFWSMGIMDNSTNKRYLYQANTFLGEYSYPLQQKPSYWNSNSGLLLGSTNKDIDCNIEFYYYRAAIFNNAVSYENLEIVINYDFEW